MADPNGTDSQFRGRGIAGRLMTRLIELASKQDYHTMIGVIDAENAASIALHKSLGFKCGGTLRQAGFKFGRWLDVGFYQLILPSPVNPEDGEFSFRVLSTSGIHNRHSPSKLVTSSGGVTAVCYVAGTDPRDIRISLWEI